MDKLNTYGPLVSKTCNEISNKLLGDVLSPVLDIKIESIDVLKPNSIVNVIDSVVNNDVITGGSTFNYTYDILGYQVSIWIIILITLVVACLCYYIYKYVIHKNNIIDYSKINESMSSSDSTHDNSSLSTKKSLTYSK